MNSIPRDVRKFFDFDSPLPNPGGRTFLEAGVTLITCGSTISNSLIIPKHDTEVEWKSVFSVQPESGKLPREPIGKYDEGHMVKMYIKAEAEAEAEGESSSCVLFRCFHSVSVQDRISKMLFHARWHRSNTSLDYSLHGVRPLVINDIDCGDGASHSHTRRIQFPKLLPGISFLERLYVANGSSDSRQEAKAHSRLQQLVGSSIPRLYCPVTSNLRVVISLDDGSTISTCGLAVRTPGVLIEDAHTLGEVERYRECATVKSAAETSLAAIHALGWVHGDICLHNVLVQEIPGELGIRVLFMGLLFMRKVVDDEEAEDEMDKLRRMFVV